MEPQFRLKPVLQTGLKVTWDEARGRIASLRTADGTELIDAAAAHGLGQVVVETLKDRGQRYVLAARNRELLAKQFRDEPVKLLSARQETTGYANSLVTTWEHPLLHRVEQRWDVLKAIPRAMLTTTIWTKEIADPCGLYVAFPLSAPKAEIVYDSVGERNGLRPRQHARHAAPSRSARMPGWSSAPRPHRFCWPRPIRRWAVLGGRCSAAA